MLLLRLLTPLPLPLLRLPTNSGNKLKGFKRPAPIGAGLFSLKILSLLTILTSNFILVFK
jgi:hypothetical protein